MFLYHYANLVGGVLHFGLQGVNGDQFVFEDLLVCASMVLVATQEAGRSNGSRCCSALFRR